MVTTSLRPVRSPSVRPVLAPNAGASDLLTAAELLCSTRRSLGSSRPSTSVALISQTRTLKSDFRAVWCLIKLVWFSVRQAHWSASQVSGSVSFHFIVFGFYITEQYRGSCRVYTFNSQICFVLLDIYVHLNVIVMTLTTFPPIFLFPLLYTNSVIFILSHKQPAPSLSPPTCLTCTFTLCWSLHYEGR